MRKSDTSERLTQTQQDQQGTAGSALHTFSQPKALSEVEPMEENSGPAESKADSAGANITPTKPRQGNHSNGKKQPRALKQLRFEGHGALRPSADPHSSSQVHTSDAAAQADLASEPLQQHPHPSPQHHPSPSRGHTHHEAHAAPPRDAAMGSGSEGSLPKRRKRTSVAKNAHARGSNGYASHAPHPGYGHHPIHGHYMHGGDFEVGHGHGHKGKKQSVHRALKQDDKGPCLNPACRTTDTPQWRLGPMFCRELCNRCGTRWQRAKNTRNPQGFFVWVRNDLRSQGLEVPDAVARPAASPELALAALREVENQPHAGRQLKVEEPEISDDDDDVEAGADMGRYEEEIMMEGEDDESDMSAPEVVAQHRGSHRWQQPPRRLQLPFDAPAHHKAHRASQMTHRDLVEHYTKAPLPVEHMREEAEEDSGASESDLLCSEVLSESHDEGSEAESDEMYMRRHYRGAQEYYTDEEESGLSQDQADEEVAVTKRGRAVKLPAKYKAEEEKLHRRKRKSEGSPEDRRTRRMHYSHAYPMDYGHRMLPPASYESPLRMQRGAGHLMPRAPAGSPMGRPAGKGKSGGSPLGRSDKSARAGDKRAREGYVTSPPRGHMGAYARPHSASYPRHASPYETGLDEADNDAVDALMGMTGAVYAH